MTKGFDKLTKREQKELQELIDDIVYEAKEVVLDYTDNPSQVSGSITEIHEDSPYLAERKDRLIKFNGKSFNTKIDKKP